MKLSVFIASWSSSLFRSESVIESPEAARHGTATGPARAERNAWWEEKERREGGGERRPNQIAGEGCCQHRRAVCTGADSV